MKMYLLSIGLCLPFYVFADIQIDAAPSVYAQFVSTAHVDATNETAPAEDQIKIPSRASKEFTLQSPSTEYATVTVPNGAVQITVVSKLYGCVTIEKPHDNGHYVVTRQTVDEIFPNDVKLVVTKK